MRARKLLERQGITLAFHLTTLKLGVSLQSIDVGKAHQIRFLSFYVPFFYLTFHWNVARKP